MADPEKRRPSALSKESCALCGQPTLPFFKGDEGTFLCVKCWRKEKSKKDPYFGLNDRLIEQVFHSDEGFDGLPEDEKIVFAIRELVIEVLNGGFHQYFYNSSGARYATAEAALERLNEPEALGLLIRARQALFARGRVPANIAERRKTIPYAREVPGSQFSDLANEEGSRFAEISDALDSHLMQFAKEAGLAESGTHPNEW
jgi:hypothetical protein